jgi:hypothetical protein
MSEEDMLKRIGLLEKAVETQRNLESLGGPLSAASLESAIDMIRGKCKFAIRPNWVPLKHESTFVAELQGDLAAKMKENCEFERVYKHFEGQTYTIYKVR